jgi:LPPG:FO 2-phospho-L-lactate transferase
MKVTALAGGVGASKLLAGMVRALPPSDLTIIVNTGDDIELHGLHISPDPDIVTYTLAGVVNPATGWGLEGDTFRALEVLARYGREAWFHLGDRDLATHMHRTALLRTGATLTQAIDAVCRAWGLEARILPMCDEFVPTILETDRGTMHFQEYLVKHRVEPVVKSIRFEGAEKASPAAGVLEAIAEADAIVVCPSNPLISIGPILAVPGIRAALRARRNCVAAVSPIVGGRSLKGPSDIMMRQLGYDAAAKGVARMYADFCGRFVLDESDAAQQDAIERMEMRVLVTQTVMCAQSDKERLAREVLVFATSSRAGEAGA